MKLTRGSVMLRTMLGMLLASWAWGQEPALSVESDGTVVAVAVIEASPDAVRAVLADVQATSRLSPEVLSVEAASEDAGRCREVKRETRGLFHPLRFVARRCPTADGWHEELVQSDDFSAYATDWTVVATEGGTRVEYRVKTSVRLPIPGAALAAALRDATATTVKNLVHAVVPEAR